MSEKIMDTIIHRKTRSPVNNGICGGFQGMDFDRIQSRLSLGEFLTP
jgi:hypothetical protein